MQTRYLAQPQSLQFWTSSSRTAASRSDAPWGHVYQTPPETTHKGKHHQNQRMYTPAARSEKRKKVNRPAHSIRRDTNRVRLMIPSIIQLYSAVNELRFFSQQ